MNFYRQTIPRPFDSGAPSIPPDIFDDLDLEGPDTGDVWNLLPVSLDAAEAMILAEDAAAVRGAED